MNSKHIMSKRKVAKYDRALELHDAVKSRYSGDSKLVLEGQAVPQSEVVAKLKSYRDVYDGIVADHRAFVKRLTESDVTLVELDAYVENVVTAIRADNGNASSELALFGIKNRKPRKPLTATQRVIAASKRRQTLEARGILGKRQRSEIVVGGQRGVTVTTENGAPIDMQRHVPPISPSSHVSLNGAPATPESASGAASAASSNASAPATAANGDGSKPSTR